MLSVIVLAFVKSTTSLLAGEITATQSFLEAAVATKSFATVAVSYTHLTLPTNREV